MLRNDIWKVKFTAVLRGDTTDNTCWSSLFRILKLTRGMASERKNFKAFQDICAKKQKHVSKMHNTKIMKTVMPANHSLRMKMVSSKILALEGKDKGLPFLL